MPESISSNLCPPPFEKTFFPFFYRFNRKLVLKCIDRKISLYENPVI